MVHLWDPNRYDQESQKENTDDCASRAPGAVEEVCVCGAPTDAVWYVGADRWRAGLLPLASRCWEDVCWGLAVPLRRPYQAGAYRACLVGVSTQFEFTGGEDEELIEARSGDRK